MKNIYIILIFSLFLSSCGEKFLDLDPVSQITTGSFYKTAEDIDLAVNAAYDALQTTGQYGQNFVYFMEVSSDNSEQNSITTSGGTYGDFDLFRLFPTNPVLDQTWKDCYAGIQRCNIVLNRIDKVEIDQSIKPVREGEVKFIRALTYFNMVRIWGDIPLVITETENPFDAYGHIRNVSEVIYQQIITDLTEAIIGLPVSYTGKDIGRATKGAAQTVLGKVYLTQKKYSEATTILNQIIAGGNYQLLGNYADIFKVANKNNNESIFEVQFRKGGTGEGSSYANLFATSTTQVGGIGAVWGDNIPTIGMMNAYPVGDKRKDASVGDRYNKKFMDTPFQDKDADNNFPALRYADVLLMYAEALNEQGYQASGNAFKFMNQVRTRAGLAAYTSANLPDQASFRLAIENERKLELAFENHRWFDLVRTGRAPDVMKGATYQTIKIEVDAHHLLFPIPQSQIDASAGKITQNPGYN